MCVCDVVALKTRVRRRREASDPAMRPGAPQHSPPPLLGFISIWIATRPCPRRPYLTAAAAAAALQARAPRAPSLPLPSPPPPACAPRLCLARRRSEPAGRVIGGRRRRSASPASANERAEPRGGRGWDGVRSQEVGLQWPSAPLEGPPAPAVPSRAVAGTGAPRGIPSPSPKRSPARSAPRSNYPAAVPRPPAALGRPRATPRSREKCQGRKAQARGQRGGAP